MQLDSGPRPTAQGGRGAIIALALIAVAASLANYARFTLTPLLEAVKSDLVLSDHQLALLQGPALALPVVLLGVPLGLWIDRGSRVRLMLLLVTGTVLGSVATALAPNFHLLLAARALVGLSATATVLVAVALIGDLFAPSARGRANMVVTLAALGGISVALAGGGALLAGFEDSPEGWRHTMVWLAAPLPLAIVAAFMLREPVRTGIAMPGAPARLAFSRLWGHRNVVLPLIGGGVLVGIADGAALVWAVPALMRGLALPADAVGAAMAGVMLISGIAGPVLGGLGADFCQRAGGPRRTIGLLAILSVVSAGAGVFALAGNLWLASALLVVFMSVGSAIAVMVTTLATVVLPNELRGLCLSAKYIANLLFGLALAPLGVSWLSGVLGGPAMIGMGLTIIATGTSLVGALIFLVPLLAVPRKESA